MKTRRANWDYDRPVGPLPQPDTKCPQCGKLAFVYCIPDDKRLVFCSECGEFTADAEAFLEFDRLVKDEIAQNDPEGEPADDIDNAMDGIDNVPDDLRAQGYESPFETRSLLGL